ncbi:MAG: ABC transporter permease [Acidimicrobiia bacterium]
MTDDLTLESYVRFFDNLVYVHITLETLWLALLTASITLMLSFPLALALVRMPASWRLPTMFLVVLSFWTSVVVRAFGWMVLLGDSGLVNRALSQIGIGPLPLMYNQTGVIVGLVHVMVPIMVFPIYASLASIDPHLEEAAEGLGATRTQRFIRINIPLAMPGILSGVLLVFLITAGFYVTPALLGGGRVLVISSVIIQQVGSLNYPFASVLSLILVIVALASSLVLARLIGRDKVEGGLFGGY